MFDNDDYKWIQLPTDIEWNNLPSGCIIQNEKLIIEVEISLGDEDCEYVIIDSKEGALMMFNYLQHKYPKDSENNNKWFNLGRLLYSSSCISE
jgi:hypothetical protein